MSSARPTREARVDLGAIRHNVATLKAATAPAAFMAVVKAGGYGHGAEAVARAALEGGADWLGVVDVEEALALREAGITAPLLAWLHGPTTDFPAALAANIDLGVSSLEQLDRIAAAGARKAGSPAYVHLKVDTGLGRNGIEESDCPAVFDRAAEYERAGLLRVRGIFSHLANTGEAEDLEQVARFEALVESATSAGLNIALRHLAATAGALRLPAARFDLVRCGIGIYGLSPFEGESSASLGLRPAMELSAAIVSVKRVPEGSGVSYGYTYRTSAESTLALVPLGYADGIPRHASSRGPVFINGRRYQISGRVAMDQFVVDLGQDTAVVGDRAVLFGDPSTGVPSADDWAEAADTINYEIVTRIGARVTRTTT
ncbi:alanine racemase [Glaciihabitans tibetensis]|uniref:Alanine racemase n=1 Tax=Glaciihabitans tibetensis TaxID=1266600 RepID=A0A2T0VBM7_9MICO|nr:alanine racemase [Glaciihabitans tibetensis]PRY67589.1 alanine racemase [Glaciihabitans tibetensis]